MRYRWTQKDIFNACNKVQMLIDHESDPEKIAFYAQIMDSVNDYMFVTYADANCRSKTYQEKVIDATECHLGYARYVQYIGAFLDELHPLYDDIAYLDDLRLELKHDRPDKFKFKRYTHEETLSLVKGFYADFDKELYDIFMKIYDERYKSVKFIKHFTNPEDPTFQESSGYCFYLGGINRAFISVDEQRGITKVSDAVHEFGHAIRYSILPSTAYSKENYFLSEVESIFPELVFLYEQGRKMDSFQSSLAMFDPMTHYYEKAALIRMQQMVINAWYDNNYRLDKHVYDRLREEAKMSRSDVYRSLNTSIKAAGPYIISFSIVLELFNLYKKDKNKAMYLYKKIVKTPSLSDEFLKLLVLENELPLFEHLREETMQVNANLASEFNMRF